MTQCANWVDDDGGHDMRVAAALTIFAGRPYGASR